MGIIPERHRNTMQRIPCKQQRSIERFPVEGNQCLRRSQEFGQAFEQGWLFGRVAHKVLLEQEITCHKTTNADQEGISTGASSQPTGFCVQEGIGFQRELHETWLACPLCQGLDWHFGFDTSVAVPVVRAKS